MASPRTASAFQEVSCLSSRPGACASHVRRTAPRAWHRGLDVSTAAWFTGDVRYRLAHREVPGAFEICLLVEAKAACENRIIVGDKCFHLHRVSRRRTGLLRLRSRHRATNRSRLSATHVGEHPVRGRCGAAKQLFAGREMRLCVHREQWAVVVQHFLEMRNLPVAVDRVAAEATADMIVDAAFGHARQGQRRHEQRVDVRFIVCAVPRQCRSSRSIVAGWGNFGAPPKPP